MKARISRAASAQILAHAADSGRFEACGLLFGTEDAIERAEPVQNVASEPEIRFEIDPRSLFAAIRAERAGGPRLIGFYHSHPTGSAEPSTRDAAMALDCGRLWVIVADGAMKAWRVAQPGRFEPVDLRLASPCPSRQ